MIQKRVHSWFADTVVLTQSQLSVAVQPNTETKFDTLEISLPRATT